MDNDKRTPFDAPGSVFFFVGIAFFVLGITGNTAFLGVGVAFFVIGIALMNKARKEKGEDDAP